MFLSEVSTRWCLCNFWILFLDLIMLRNSSIPDMLSRPEWAIFHKHFVWQSQIDDLRVSENLLYWLKNVVLYNFLWWFQKSNGWLWSMSEMGGNFQIYGTTIFRFWVNLFLNRVRLIVFDCAIVWVDPLVCCFLNVLGYKYLNPSRLGLVDFALFISHF